ncbi:MAG: protein translocase subunit SecD [Bdellovibrionales bacterium]
MQYYKTRLVLALGGLILAVLWVVPNVVPVQKWITDNRLNYGLDIQGGLHLVMGVDVEGVVAETTTREIKSLEAELTKAGIVADLSAPNGKAGEIQIKTAQGSKVQELMDQQYSTLFQLLKTENDVMTYRYLDAYLLDYRARIINQAIETIRNHIDEFGVAEPSIAAQGSDRILVQLPGMSDAERAKELINTTAKLDFMIVSYDVPADKLADMISKAEKAGNYTLATLKYSDYITRLNQDLKSQLPANTVIYFEKSQNAQRLEVGAVPYLLKTDTGLGGNDLDNAFVSFGQYGEPEVSLRFNPAGAGKFADLTGANVNRQMAIVLDRIVKSAPSIRDRIAGGSAVISLGSGNRDESLKEAQMISTALRAGALPARLEQLEERRVGPTLGADSIKKAQMGAYVGAALVLLFLMIYYKGMGVLASVSMGVNIVSLIALLAAFGATLTLPGIAGIALTVGFAVDANVLIMERIKEELARGASWVAALREGYSAAMSAIFDSNITVASVAVILFYFGTGPVRGFAITLLLGIITTIFGNVFFSKVLADTLVGKLGIKRISI